MTARIYGRAGHVDEQGRTELEPFIEALKSSPLFADAVLRDVVVPAAGEPTGQRFEATFTVVLAPDPAVLAAASAQEKGGAP